MCYRVSNTGRYIAADVTRRRYESHREISSQLYGHRTIADGSGRERGGRYILSSGQFRVEAI